MSTFPTNFSVPNFSLPPAGVNFPGLDATRSGSTTSRRSDLFERLLNDKNLSKEVKDAFLTAEILKQVDTNNPEDDASYERRLRMNEESRQREALRAQAIGKESLAEAFKYKMLADIPKTIANSFSNIATTNLLGSDMIARNMANTLNAYPRLQLSPYQYQPQRYFS